MCENVKRLPCVHGHLRLRQLTFNSNEIHDYYEFTEKEKKNGKTRYEEYKERMIFNKIENNVKMKADGKRSNVLDIQRLI